MKPSLHIVSPSEAKPLADAYALVPDYVSITRSDYRTLTTMAGLGKTLGRNIERLAAFATFALSVILVLLRPDAIVYGFYTRAMDAATWGWVFGVLATARGVTLIVNGRWPVTLQVRVAFCVATLFLVWGSLTAAYFFTADSAAVTTLHGGFLPGMVLAPFALLTEVLCFLALRTRMLDEKGARAGNERRSMDRGDRGGERAAAGVC